MLGTIDTTHPTATGEKMLINQWYLMRFECYLTEIANIEQLIVDHRGRVLSEMERIHLYQTLFGAVKDANGNPMFPIPRDWSAANTDLIKSIIKAYNDLGMIPPFSTDPTSLWYQLYISTSTQTTLPV